jgi:hypothetical protein
MQSRWMPQFRWHAQRTDGSRHPGRQRPTSKGFDRTAWIFPIVAFVAGVFAVGFVVRAWKKRALVASAAGPPVGNGEWDKFRRQADEETEL